MKTTIYGMITIMSFIFAVGCIDGPTGHESDNWGGMVAFMITGLIFAVLTLKAQINETE